ncbi:hypothetical protein [Rhizobacter sp. OV335]|jgi:hypothetical protein|uniref:hypothetical protein n=1 Tax=Rhizobacter sp. OV335 TaxID=1500264 RepID=UPI00091B593F|nr:hypothetical protein [Rhizobacter sp. OV335]SHN18972.1 hypothetical protein SAMN02787076_03938 [Rhizobacter sp. OV335]
MTVNEQPFDVPGVQFGFEASIPGGLRLALDNSYIEVDRHGAVPGPPGLYAAGEVSNFWWRSRSRTRSRLPGRRSCR